MAKRPVTIYMHQNLENSHHALNRPHFRVINKQQQQQLKRRVNLMKKAFLRNFHVSLPPKETKSQTSDIQSTPVFLLLTLIAIRYNLQSRRGRHPLRFYWYQRIIGFHWSSNV